jgi:hypothetical protein
LKAGGAGAKIFQIYFCEKCNFPVFTMVVKGVLPYMVFI